MSGRLSANPERSGLSRNIARATAPTVICTVTGTLGVWVGTRRRKRPSEPQRNAAFTSQEREDGFPTGYFKRRAMRGLVARVRCGAVVQDRRLVDTGLGFRRSYKVCTWCQRPTDEPRRRYWHSECAVWHGASRCSINPHTAKKLRNIPYSPTREVYEEYFSDYDPSCVQCGSTKLPEIEHELAISVAVALGPDAIIRAFMPDNLRWMCHDCHVEKTRRDRLILKMVKGTIRLPEGCDQPRLFA